MLLFEKRFNLSRKDASQRRNVLSNYVLLTVILTIVFTSALYITGFIGGGDAAQSLINKNVLSSVEQIKNEGAYPRILNGRDYSFQLDNFTDTIMLQESMLMNTKNDPLTIFTNPRNANKYDNKEYHDSIIALEEAAITNVGEEQYFWYWQGYRVFLRPLLIFFDYQSIRALVALIFLMAFVVSVIFVYRVSGTYFAIAYTVAIACMNIPVCASELQFSTCFMIVFLGMCGVASVMHDKMKTSMLFYIIGACTQYFDFYTYPLITLGFPLVFYVQECRESGIREQCVLCLKAMASWFAGYGLFWLIRLGIVEAFTDHNAFSIAFGRVGLWTGTIVDSRYTEYTPFYSIKLCLHTIMRPYNVLFVVLYFAGCVVLKCFKNKGEMCLLIPSPVFLIIAFIPILWIAVASKATGNHFWFQYRILGVSLFAGNTIWNNILFLPQSKDRV